LSPGAAAPPPPPSYVPDRGFFLVYRDVDKSLARPGRKQVTATEDFYVHISYLLSQLEEY